LVMQGLPQILELDLSRFVHHLLHRRLSSCAFALVREPQSSPKPTPEFQSRRPRRRRYSPIAVQRRAGPGRSELIYAN
jgi:hypothetical protein